MPDKPTWCGDLERIGVRLRELACPWVDRQTLQELLGVGRRRAQQILASCSNRRIGSSVVADRDSLVAHLERLACGEARYYERRRRLRLARTLTELNQAWRQRPHVLVEAPAALSRPRPRRPARRSATGPGRDHRALRDGSRSAREIARPGTGNWKRSRLF